MSWWDSQSEECGRRLVEGAKVRVPPRIRTDTNISTIKQRSSAVGEVKLT